MTDSARHDPDEGTTDDGPMTRAEATLGDEESGTPPHPSPADGGSTEPAERAPRPSQAEGER